MGQMCESVLTSDDFKPIPKHPHYMASRDGRIFSLYTMKWLSPVYSKNTGYLQVAICEDGKKMTRSIHRLIAEAFVPNDDPSLVVNHKDENKTNNNAGNLEWVTTRENVTYGSAIRRRVESAGIENLRESAARAREARMKAHAKPVVNIDTGVVYGSVGEAAAALNLRRTGIWGSCNKRQKTCGGYRWKYESETGV